MDPHPWRGKTSRRQFGESRKHPEKNSKKIPGRSRKKEEEPILIA
jgi:hypothetical protein